MGNDNPYGTPRITAREGKPVCLSVCDFHIHQWTYRYGQTDILGPEKIPKVLTYKVFLVEGAPTTVSKLFK